METKETKTKQAEKLSVDERLAIMAAELKGKDLFPRKTAWARKFLAGISDEDYKMLNL